MLEGALVWLSYLCIFIVCKHLHYHLLNCNLTISLSIYIPHILKSFHSFLIFPRIYHSALSMMGSPLVTVQ